MAKLLSGSFLSQVVLKLSEFNLNKVSQDELVEQLAELAKSPTALVELEDTHFQNDSVPLSKFPQQRLGGMSQKVRATLNALLPWSSFNVVNKMPLGSAYLGAKRSVPHAIPDVSYKEVAQFLGPDSRVLEVGCFEGHYASTLAMFCGQVYAFDSRIENVLKTLVRTWALGLDRKVVCDVLDIETTSVADFYRQRQVASFDLIYHRGVLYHLGDPVGHLADIAPLAKVLYLSTQYAADEQANEVMETPHGKFNVFSYREKTIDFGPFSGMVPKAYWLRKDQMLALLTSLGFTEIEVTCDEQERNGRRITLIAKK